MHTTTPEQTIGPPPQAEDFGGTTTAIVRAEVDLQISTARQYPRSIQKATQNAVGLATSSRAIAEGCYYSVPRAGKNITGPSVEMATILASTWGNLRFGARPIRMDDKFVYAQGVCHDLESNIQFSAEVARRITNRNGQKFSDDMIATTTAAACSIALRNAILKVVPNWREVYNAVLSYLQGDAASLPETREKCVVAFREFGVTGEMLAKKMERERVDDLTAADVFDLRGFYTAIKDGDAKVETIFPTEEATKVATNASALKDKVDAVKAKRQAKPEPEAKPEADPPAADETPEPTPPDTEESNHVTLDAEPLEAAAEPTRITLEHVLGRTRGIYAARKSMRDVLTKFIFNQQQPKNATPDQLAHADDILTAFVTSGKKPDEIADLLDRLKGITTG